MKQIYLDFAATTPVDDAVLEAMLPYFKENFGNASSAHHAGQAAKLAVEKSRETIAAILGAEPSEIIFTSGGTESDNAAIKGTLAASSGKNEIITSRLEHHAVLHTAEAQEKHGFKVLFSEVNSSGVIMPEAVAGLISEKTALVSIMQINNEIGTINPIAEIAEICRAKHVPFHTDAVQSVGKIPVNVKEQGIDLLSATAHKFYGPKGIGILYLKKGTPWKSQQTGGSQENNRRGGTLNVPGIVGFAKALELATREIEKNTLHYQELKKLLLGELRNRQIGFKINGDTEHGVPHILNLSFEHGNGHYADGEILLFNLDLAGICVSRGSACAAGATEPSHVLSGLGISDDAANASLRISLGKTTTPDELRYFAQQMEEIMQRMYSAA